MPVQYYYFNDRLPQANLEQPRNVGGLLTGLDNAPLSPSVSILTDPSNPVYNFRQEFINNLQSALPGDVAQAVPYISVYSLDQNGEVKTDFTKEFFFKTIDMSALNAQARFVDRPQISLENVSINQTLADGGGFLTRSTISLSLKLHKPDLIANKRLEALLLPGMPMKIIFGWSSNNETLNSKDVLLFNIRDYDIQFDRSGQANLTLNGNTFIENFASIFVGDLAEALPGEDENVIDFSDTPLAIVNDGSTNVSEAQGDGLRQKQLSIQTFLSYVSTSGSSRNTDGQRDLAVSDRMAAIYSEAASRVSTAIEARYNEAKRQLEAKRKPHPEWFKEVVKLKSTGERVGSECVTVHDIIGTLCGPTLNALEGTIIPSGKNFRFVYGSFNETLGSFSSKSIANFPINWRMFDNILKENGAVPPSIQGLFNILGNNFIGNEEYWRRYLVRDDSVLDIPKICFHVSTHFIQDNEISQVSLVDINRNVPLTQRRLQSNHQSLVSEDDYKQTVLRDTPIPVIRIGHCASFVKSISMSHENNSYIKAFLINRATATDSSARQAITQNKKTPLQQRHGLFLPLKGEMTLLGQVDWKPARFFYLSSGIYFLDGAYVITAVTHTLDAAGFNTRIEFAMH